MWTSKAYRIELASASQVLDAIENAVSALGKAQSEEKQALSPLNSAIDRYIDSRDLAEKSISLLKDLEKELKKLGVDIPRDFGMAESRAKGIKSKSDNKIAALQRARRELT